MQATSPRGALALRTGNLCIRVGEQTHLIARVDYDRKEGSLSISWTLPAQEVRWSEDYQVLRGALTDAIELALDKEAIDAVWAWVATTSFHPIFLTRRRKWET